MINYEVFCFCPIETYENNWVLEQKIFKRMDYQYILVGGFDINKRKGLIKLFKIQFNPKIDEIKIEYIQDMIFEKSFKGKGSITSIYQNIENGIIYAIFSDGNMSSFSPPKIGIKENNWKIIFKKLGSKLLNIIFKIIFFRNILIIIIYIKN